MRDTVKRLKSRADTAKADMAQAALSIVRGHSEFGHSEVQTGLSISAERARGVVRTLVARGLCRMVSVPAHGCRALYELTDAGRAELPATVTGKTDEERLWTAARGIGGGFTARMLTVYSAVPVSEDVAARYCRFLLAAGYLGVVRKAVPGKSPAMYRLVRNTGPLPPLPRRVLAVADANLATLALVGGAP